MKKRTIAKQIMPKRDYTCAGYAECLTEAARKNVMLPCAGCQRRKSVEKATKQSRKRGKRGKHDQKDKKCVSAVEDVPGIGKNS